MSQICQVCGRGPDIGRRVSYSGKHNKKKRSLNLQRVRAIYRGRRRRMWVCTRCIRAGKVSKAA
ncbi:MAG: 50S ribosomal protein L28 [Candidatus Bipolaricaulia bacterium]